MSEITLFHKDKEYLFSLFWKIQSGELLMRKGYKIFSLGGSGDPPEGVNNLNFRKKFKQRIIDLLHESIKLNKPTIDLAQDYAFSKF